MSEDIHDAQPADVYVDPLGHIWKVESRCDSPTVTLVQLDGDRKTSEPQRMHGGTGGLMWQGFKRIHRPEENHDHP